MAVNLRGRSFLKLLDFPFSKNIGLAEKRGSSYQQSETRFTNLALIILIVYKHIFALSMVPCDIPSDSSCSSVTPDLSF